MFAQLIDTALSRYQKTLDHKKNVREQMNFKRYVWSVPEERLYREESHRILESVTDHALLPFVELRNASLPEKRFEAFLEENKEYIDWWYKNGNAGRQHYAISYESLSGAKRLFYVDFVIRLTNGRVFLFDTKTMGSDPDAVAKHNALIDYMAGEENLEKHLRGGILIEQGGNWKYNPKKIDNTIETLEWDCFIPSIDIKAD